MLARAGKLRDAPDMVRSIDPDFDVEYLGSLARSQKVDTAAAIERVVASAAGMAAQGMPRAIEAVDPIGAVQEIARALNVPISAMRDQQEVQERVQKLDAQEAAAMEAQQAQMAGEAAQTVAEAEGMVNEGQGTGPGTLPAGA
jgi:Bacteriophage head to tail connecting protein.